MARIIDRASVLVACLAVPIAALAQGQAPPKQDPTLPLTQEARPQPPNDRPGKYGRLTFATAAVYDSNLFATQGPQAEGDFISRAAPMLEGGYRTVRVKFNSRYGFESERYFSHPQLNRLLAHQQGGMDLTWQATRRLRFGTGANYVSTQTPAELNVDTFISAGRARAQREAADGTIAYSLTSLTGLMGDFDYSRDLFGTGVTQTQLARIGLNRRTDRRTEYRFNYTAQQIDFSGFTLATVNTRELTHLLLGGWTHKFFLATTLSIDAGPRILNGKAHGEGTVRLDHTSAKVDLSVSFGRTRATAIGTPGTVDVRQVTVAGAYHPNHRLTVGGSSGYARSTQATRLATVVTLQGDLTFQLERRLAFVTSAHYGQQTGTIAGPGSLVPVRASVPFRSVSFGVTLSLPGLATSPRRVQP